MIFRVLLVVSLSILLGEARAQATPEQACPVTIGVSELFAPPFPGAPTRRGWYGSETLAVQLPADGKWPTTRPGSLIAIKLFWWSVNYKAGSERDLEVTVESVFDSSPSSVPRVTAPTSAHADDLGGWTMLTGIDFPTAGCWRVSGQYQGQKLEFVMETVEFSEWKGFPN